MELLQTTVQLTVQQQQYKQFMTLAQEKYQNAVQRECGIIQQVGHVGNVNNSNNDQDGGDNTNLLDKIGKEIKQLQQIIALLTPQVMVELPDVIKQYQQQLSINTAQLLQSIQTMQLQIDDKTNQLSTLQQQIAILQDNYDTKSRQCVSLNNLLDNTQISINNEEKRITTQQTQQSSDVQEYYNYIAQTDHLKIDLANQIEQQRGASGKLVSTLRQHLQQVELVIADEMKQQQKKDAEELAQQQLLQQQQARVNNKK